MDVAGERAMMAEITTVPVYVGMRMVALDQSPWRKCLRRRELYVIHAHIYIQVSY
jgi:hypothetical protein